MPLQLQGWQLGQVSSKTNTSKHCTVHVHVPIQHEHERSWYAVGGAQVWLGFGKLLQSLAATPDAHQLASGGLLEALNIGGHGIVCGMFDRGSADIHCYIFTYIFTV